MPPQFTDSELEALSKIAKDRDHRVWLGGIVYRAAKWVAAVALGVTVAWDALARLIGHFTRQ